MSNLQLVAKEEPVDDKSNDQYEIKWTRTTINNRTVPRVGQTLIVSLLGNY